MNINIRWHSYRFVIDGFLLIISRLVPVKCGWFNSIKMDNSILEEARKLLHRLTEAERRAKLLKCEIKDIRTQIATLTQSANSILSEKTSLGLSLRNNRSKASKTALTDSVIASTSKRPLDELDSLGNQEAKRSRNDIPEENGYAVVYTDGACENNGKPNAKAGIGVWFSDHNPMNISKPVIGRATNNTSEIQAPTEALKLLKSLGYKKVKILTDSQFTINCITKWIQKWKLNQWKLANGGPVKNKEDLIKLDNLCQQFQDIKWEYCAGHKGIKGNEEADKLARNGASRYVPS